MLSFETQTDADEDMRKFIITITILSLSAVLAPASALQANDTMTTWKNSSTKERSELLKRLLGKHSGGDESANILKCVNETSNISAHNDLTIADVVKTCGSPENAGQPV